MNNISTPETLMQYIYGLLEKEEAIKVEALLESNADLKREFLALQSVKMALDQDDKSKPSQESIDIIMHYAEIQTMECLLPIG